MIIPNNGPIMFQPSSPMAVYQFMCSDSQQEEIIRSCIVTTAANFLNIKYQWGGLSPEQGFDCSGFVWEVLTSLGFKFPSNGEGKRRSQFLFDIMIGEGKRAQIMPGDLLWFGKSITEITHIAIAISDMLMIEAGGEGSESTNAGFIRIRPIRKDLVAFRSPIQKLIKSFQKVNYASLK